MVEFCTLSRIRPVGWDKVNFEDKTGGKTAEKDLVKKVNGKKRVGIEGLTEWGEGMKVVRNGQKIERR